MDAGLLQREVTPFWKAVSVLVVSSIAIASVAFTAGTAQMRKVNPRVEQLEAFRDSTRAELAAGQSRDSTVVERLDRILCYLQAEQTGRAGIECAR